MRAISPPRDRVAHLAGGLLPNGRAAPRSDPSNARTRDVFAVGMTLAVAAVGRYLADLNPKPSEAALACVAQFVADNAYVAGTGAKAIAAREVAAQWLHLHSLDQLRAAAVLRDMPPRVAAELAQLCAQSQVEPRSLHPARGSDPQTRPRRLHHPLGRLPRAQVRALLVQRLGGPLCELTLRMLSADVTAEEALGHPALANAREGADPLEAKRSISAAVRDAIPDALQELLALAVVELWGVCSRLPMAAFATRALSPLVRISRLDQLGCRALELTGVSVEGLLERTAGVAPVA